MTERVKLDGDTERKLQKLVADVAKIAEDVNDIKHTLAALATSIQIADNVPALVAESKAHEAEDNATREAEKKRRRRVTALMSTCNESGPAARLRWLTDRLAGSELGPINESDLEQYNLREPTQRRSTSSPRAPRA